MRPALHPEQRPSAVSARLRISAPRAASARRRAAAGSAARCSSRPPGAGSATAHPSIASRRAPTGSPPTGSANGASASSAWRPSLSACTRRSTSSRPHDAEPLSSSRGALLARAPRPDYARFEAQLRSSGYCARPVRLQGTSRSARARPPTRVVDRQRARRRAAQGVRQPPRGRLPAVRRALPRRRLPAIAAGLRGGKGVPESVAEHPALFVTLTAPSFGLVHTRPLRPDGTPRRCRPRRDAPVCPHGVRLSCGRVHDEDDPCLGEPLCRECFDHSAAVVWNNALGELWRRTTIYLPRALARLTGMTHKALRELVRVSYARSPSTSAAAWSTCTSSSGSTARCPPTARGELHPPSSRFDVEPARGRDPQRRRTRSARRRARGSVAGEVRWGEQLDVRQLDRDERGEVAGYLAKYATKSTELAGGVAAPRRRAPARRAPRARTRPRLHARGLHARPRHRARQSALRRLRARARLPRPLPDQEPALLHVLRLSSLPTSAVFSRHLV